MSLLDKNVILLSLKVQKQDASVGGGGGRTIAVQVMSWESNSVEYF